MSFPRNSLAALAVAILCAFVAAPAQAAEFTVNATVDVGDTRPGDGICDYNPDQPGGQCTLRAAVQETNGLNDIAPSHTINVPAGTYTLTGGVLSVNWNLNLVGAGARNVVIQQGGVDRVLRVDFWTLNVSGVTIRGGTANANNGFFGGNVFNEGGNLNIAGSKIADGHAGSGGGVSNFRGDMTITRSTFSGNAADIGGGDSGAIHNAGNADGASTLTIENSTISGNTARLGGGILSGGNSSNSVVIRNSTIAGNASNLQPFRGGGGGLLIGSGTATLENSIVALNQSFSAGQENCSRDPGATIASSGSNLESGSECGFTSLGDRQNANPLLGPLQNAGGQTDTRPLLAGSPATDAGKPATCLSTDQRGVARPQGPRCDIGAYEAVIAQTAPDTIIVSSPPSVTTDRTPTFTFSSNRAGATFECSLNNGPYLPCSSPYTLSMLPAGTHTLEIRARDAGGVDATPAAFTFVIPAQLSDLPPPALGRTVNAEPVSGNVTVAVPAGASSARGARAAQKGLRFIPLREARQLPVGTFFNTRKGRVRLQTATTRRGRRQAGVFFGGLFQTLQARRGSSRGIAELRLKGSSFKSCRTAGHGKGKRAATSRHGKRSVRRLRGDARGRFRTRGRYSAATVRGTIWDVSDRCDGTLTKVTRGRVTVRDFRRRKNISLRAGKRYLARARR